MDIFGITLILNLAPISFPDVDVEAVQSCRTLESVNLEENPLTRDASVALSNITSVRVIITPRDLEEWEDLSI